MTTIRRALQDTVIGARASKMTTLTQSFAAAMGANRLLQPANDNAKAHLLAMINTDVTHPSVASARQSLGNALLAEFRGAVSRGDLNAAATWLNEARGTGFSGDDLKTAEGDLVAARDKAASQGSSVVGANSLERIEYVAPKFPAANRNRTLASSGFVELEFTVMPDGSTGNVTVTNSNPRKTFDAAAIAAVSEWRYKPVMREGKAVEQRVAVRIRFSDQ
jgi:TonB family protein